MGKRPPLVIVAALCALAFTAPVQAGLLSGFLPGLVSPPATTPPMCFAPGDWKLRFFATGGTVRVKIVVKSLLGVLSVLDGGTVSSGGTWQPSAELKLYLTNIGSVLATDSISLRLAAGST